MVIWLKSVLGLILVRISYGLYIVSLKYSLLRVFERTWRFLINVMGLSYYPIESFDTYSAKYNCCERELLKEDRLGVSVYSIQPDDESQEVLRTRLWSLYSSLYKDVQISGDSDIIVDLNHKCIISDYCYNMNKNVVFIDGLLYRNLNNIGLLRSNFKGTLTDIEAGIMISGKFSRNYYHEMYENLNRLLLLQYTSIPQDVPLLMDEIVDKIPSFKKMAEILANDCKRPIVYLKPNRIYSCKSLYYLDHINDIVPHPKDYRNGYVPSYYDPLFIEIQRTLLLRYRTQISTPKRIFITRSNRSLRKFNEDEIFNVLARYGFEKVVPEMFSFEEQMTLFNNAEWIIGCSGAAFSNLLFCNEKCKALAFRAVRGVTGTPVFSTIAWICKMSYWHYEPDYIKKNKGIHSDFYVDPERFENMLVKLLAS